MLVTSCAVMPSRDHLMPRTAPSRLPRDPSRKRLMPGSKHHIHAPAHEDVAYFKYLSLYVRFLLGRSIVHDRGPVNP
jgi:hypothetical protein